MAFTEEMFQAALEQPRLQQPLPAYISNRTDPIPVLGEDELRAMTKRWFQEHENRIKFYADRGLDIGWTLDWSKRYWWSWLTRDMSHNDELYAQDIVYKDVTTMGGYLKGLDEFVAYNFAFFDAIPDWRYDPIPGQIYFDFSPTGEVSFAVRYYGSGHWSGPLKLHPFDDTAPSIPGTGAFVQATAVDRYHFNNDRLLQEGETLYDLLEGLQTSGVAPGPGTAGFRRALKVAAFATKAKTRLKRPQRLEFHDGAHESGAAGRLPR